MLPLKRHFMRLHTALLLCLLTLVGGCGTGHRRDLPPEEVIENARSLMANFEFSPAKDLLNSQASRFPEDHSLHPDFLYLKALANWHAVPPVPDDVLGAITLLEEFLERYPDHSLAPTALLYMGRIHDIRDFAGDIPNYEAARQAYLDILERFPDHRVAPDAVLRYGMTYIKHVDDPEQIRHGITIIQDWFEHNPDTPHSPLIALFLGQMHDQFLDDRQTALSFFRQAADLGFINPGRAGANLWRIIELSVEAGYEVAGHTPPVGGWMDWDYSLVPDDLLAITIHNCQTIISEYPRSGRGYESLQILNNIREARPDIEFDIPPLQLFEAHAEDPS